jgi:hypothetical protein
MAQRQTSGKRLRKNHSSAIPRYIIALDTETLPRPADANGRKFTHKLRLAVLIVGRLQGDKIVGEKTYYCKTKWQIWQVIKNFTGINYTTWLVCHNAMFDMVISGMPEEFENASLSIDSPRSVRKQSDSDVEQQASGGLCCIESPPFILGARVGSTQGRLVIVDTLNWFQCPLADLGGSCRLEKLSMPEFTAEDSDWFTYCERDTRITFESFVGLLRWVKDNDMGMFRYTGPAQSMAAFRHRFMEHEILLHDNLPIKVIERSAYFGGRFECWKIGEINETVHQFDVNALFPSVMLVNNFPVALDTYELRNAWIYPAELGLDDSCVAEVELSTNIDIFPHRCERGVTFPTGRFRTTLCGPELVRSINSRQVRQVRSIARYRTEPIFNTWVNSLWGMRQAYKEESNALYERFVKMLMNSLYGKFGQRSPEWVNCPDRLDALPWMTWVDYDASSGERCVYRSFGWQVQKQQDRELRHHAEMDVSDWAPHADRYGKGEIDSSFVAISAFVTAYARMRMNDLRTIAGPENVYYQGVDSLIVTNRGRENLENNGQVSESELGKLRLQLSANYGYISGCSDYKLGEKVVMSGLARTPKQQVLGQQTQMTMLAKPYLFQGKPLDSVLEKHTDWNKTATYWKRRVDQTGATFPLVKESGAITSAP